MKPSLRIILSLFMALVAFAASAFDFEVDGFQYSIVSLEDKTAELSGISDGTEVPVSFTVPSTVMYGNRNIRVVSIGKNVFSRLNIEELSLGLYTKVLDTNCFSYCKKLERVILSEATDSICSAFYGCNNLKEITFKSEYCFVDWSTFYDCSSLSVVNIPSMKAWCSYKFNNPLFLECVDVALYINGEKVEDVTFPNNFSKVRDYCFATVKSIKSVALPNNITKIGEAAFAGTGITNFTIPSACDTICQAAFQGCQLSELRIPSNVKYIQRMGGGFYDYGDLNIGTLIFEQSQDSLEFQNEYQFMDRVSITNLIINRPIKQLTYQNVHYKNGVWITDPPKLDASAFYGMKSLESVEIGEYIGEINPRYFRGCSSLKSLKISDSDSPLVFMQDFGFTKEHINYYDYYIPIYYSEFEDCPLEDIYIGRNIVYERLHKESYYHELESNRPSPFNTKKSVSRITIGNSVNELPAKSLFSDCPIKFISVGERLSVIPENTFYHSENTLENIVVYSIVPPTYETGFSNYDYVNATLYIPTGTLAVYQAVEPWSKFWNISTDKYNSIDCFYTSNNGDFSISILNQTIIVYGATIGQAITIYDLNGRIITTTTENEITLPSGIYILIHAGKSLKFRI